LEQRESADKTYNECSNQKLLANKNIVLISAVQIIYKRSGDQNKKSKRISNWL